MGPGLPWSSRVVLTVTADPLMFVLPEAGVEFNTSISADPPPEAGFVGLFELSHPTDATRAILRTKKTTGVMFRTGFISALTR